MDSPRISRRARVCINADRMTKPFLSSHATDNYRPDIDGLRACGACDADTLTMCPKRRWPAGLLSPTSRLIGLVKRRIRHLAIGVSAGLPVAPFRCSFRVPQGPVALHRPRSCAPLMSAFPSAQR